MALLLSLALGVGLADRLSVRQTQAFWIGNADVPLAHSTKIEDARTSQWLRNLNPLTDPVEFIDHGWAMGDFNQLDLSVETVALRSSCPFLLRLAIGRGN